MLIKFALFVFYLAIDVIYAKFLFAFNNNKAATAASYSVLLTVMGIYGFIEAYKDMWNMIPIALGCWLGTFLTVKLRKPSEE